MDSSRYRLVRIPKRSGGIRILEIPDPDLMLEQRKILRWLMARRLAASPYAHGFIRGRSIATNAAPHVGKKIVIRIDIQEFFPSVTAQMVRYALVDNGIFNPTCYEITETCTLNGRLPQGAPTSPFLANLVAVRLDHRLAGLARNWAVGSIRTTFTRYADDLVFSSDDPHLNRIVPAVRRIVEDVGFKVNPQKTRVYRRGVRQIVAGVVVNDRANVTRILRRQFRAELHQARRCLMLGDSACPKVGRLRGTAAHIVSIHSDWGRRFMRDVGEIERLAQVAGVVTSG